MSDAGPSGGNSFFLSKTQTLYTDSIRLSRRYRRPASKYLRNFGNFWQRRFCVHNELMRVCCVLLILAWLACPLLMPAQHSLAQRLDAKERQLERLYAEYWRAEYRIALGDEHVSSRPVQENIRAVVIDDAFIKSLQTAHFRNRILRRRRDLFLEEATYTKISNDPKLTGIVEAIVQRENSMRYEVGSRHLTRAELTETLFHNPNRQLREQAWKAQTQITAVNGERIRQAIRMRNELAFQSTDELFSTFMLRRKGLETERLFEWFESIRSQTEPEYQQLRERFRRELNVDQVEPWDLEFYFSTLTNDFEQSHFVPDQGWMQAKQLTGRFGYRLNKLPVEMQLADLSFAGAAYPILYGRDVKILANRYSGIFFYDRLFHATGHALHYSMMEEPSFLLRANCAEPFDEGLAQVVALMLYRPEVDSELFGLTPEQARLLSDTHRLRELFDLRNTMADSLFEFEAYADPDQDLAALYNRIHSKYLGVDMHGVPVWAFNQMYGSDPIYLQSYVVGEMVARQILDTLDQRFGNSWSERAGKFLKINFYSRGAEKTLDALMLHGTGEPLNERHLIASLGALGATQTSAEIRGDTKSSLQHTKETP
jgi:Peptidase family M3